MDVFYDNLAYLQQDRFKRRASDFFIYRYGLRLPLTSDPTVTYVLKGSNLTLSAQGENNLENFISLNTKRYTETQLFMLAWCFLENHKEFARDAVGAGIESQIHSAVDFSLIHSVPKSLKIIWETSNRSRMFTMLQNRREEKNWLLNDTEVPTQKETYVPMLQINGVEMFKN